MTSVHRIATTLAAVAVVAQAHAGTTTYTDRSSFLTALAPGFYTETFIGSETTSFSGAGFGFTVAAPDGTYASGTDLGANQVEQALTITFTGHPVTAVGGNFYATDINPDFLPESLTVALSDGTTLVYTPTGKDTFRGFVTTSSISSLTVAFAAQGMGRYTTVDNLTVGTNVALVPEPGQWALMALGLSGLALLKRRRIS